MPADDPISAAQRSIEEIAKNRLSGASELLEHALEALSLLSEACRGPVCPSQESLGQLLDRLLQAQPSMAPLLNLAQEALAIISHSRKGRVGHDLEGLVRRWRYRRQADGRDIARQMISTLEHARNVVTYSRSGTLLDGLRHCREVGLSFRIAVSQGSPSMEGVVAARELGDMGYPVTLTTDPDLSAELKQADALLVGADAILSEGVVNKIGTYALAEAAHRGGVPVYVVSGKDKVLPVDLLPRFQIQSGFDLTPMDLITRIIPWQNNCVQE